MHLKFGYCVLYTPIYRLTERKKRVHVQNFPCRTVGAKKGYVRGPHRARQGSRRIWYKSIPR